LGVCRPQTVKDYDRETRVFSVFESTRALQINNSQRHRFAVDLVLKNRLVDRVEQVVARSGSVPGRVADSIWPEPALGESGHKATNGMDCTYESKILANAPLLPR